MKQRIVDYLTTHFEVTPMQAIELVNEATAQIAQAEEWEFRPYFVGDPIAKNAKLRHKNPCPVCGANGEGQLNF